MEQLAAEPTGRRSGNPLRRLYDWVLRWAERPGGPVALGVLAFAESSVFPIPPDPLLIALSLGSPRRSFVFATICTVCSVVGGIAGYAIGLLVWESVGGFFFNTVPGVSPESFTAVQDLYRRWDFWAVFLAGLTPLPYKVFTIAAGVFQISFPIFVLASAVSRGARFFALAGLIYFYGRPIQGFIDRNFNRIAWAFGILLVAGFAFLRFLR